MGKKESHGFTYDVFISFRGEDTRYTFIGYLRDALERKRIKAFRDDDDDDLRIGEDISPAISKAIEESNIFIVVLSVNYASSKWCLDELVKILDCRKKNNKQFVFPIFYHVDPSEVRYQRNSYGQAMTKHEDRLGKNSVETWKSALSEICRLKGLHINTAKGYEIDFIEQIVSAVYDNVDSQPLYAGQKPIGLEHQTQVVEPLKDMKPNEDTTWDKLYCEVLDVPLPELQGLKTLKVAFHHATKDGVAIHTIILPKQGTVGDVLDDLKTKVELSHTNAELRLLRVDNHKIYKVFLPSVRIEKIDGKFWTLRVEEIPEEEKNLGPYDRLIHVCHFTKVTTWKQMQRIKYFGEPFLLVIHERETLAETKVRIWKKLRVPADEFVKVILSILRTLTLWTVVLREILIVFIGISIWAWSILTMLLKDDKMFTRENSERPTLDGQTCEISKLE